MTNLYKAELFSEKCFEDTFKIEVASYRLMYSRVLLKLCRTIISQMTSGLKFQ